MQIITLTTTNKAQDNIVRSMGFNVGRIKNLFSTTRLSYDEGSKREVIWTVSSAVSNNDIKDYNSNVSMTAFINKWGNNLVNDTRTLFIDNIVYIMANPLNLSETLVWYRDPNRIELSQVYVNQIMANFIIACNIANGGMQCYTVTSYLIDGNNTVNHSLGSELVGLEIFRAGRKITIDDWYNIDENNININIPGGGGFTASINCYIR